MEWNECTLKYVLESKGYIRGPFGSSLKRNELNTKGIPVYEQQNAIYNNREFRYFIDDAKYNELSRFTVKENDLLVSCSGTLGRVSIIEKGDPVGIISQALLLLRPDVKKITPNYLKYFFVSDEGYNSLISRSSGSVQVNLAKREIIESIKIILPPLSEQRAIAEILSSIDDKIELNNQMNRTLEATAQAIFKQWFVDFEFPYNTNELNKTTLPLPKGEMSQSDRGGGAVGYKSSGGKMIDSELGPIPEGWRVGIINDLASLKNGKTSPERISNLTIPVYGANGIIGFSNDFNSDENTIVIGRVGSYCGSLYYSLEKSWITDNAIICNSNESNYSKFVYYTLKNSNLNNKSSGSGQPLLNQGIIGSLKILIPSEAPVVNFEIIATSFFKQIFNNNIQSQTLSTLRDSLLPKLMSGELRVPEEIVKSYENII